MAVKAVRAAVGTAERQVLGVENALPGEARVLEAAATALRVGFGYEHDLTFYAEHGDLFAYACAFITTLGLAFSLTGRATNPGAPRPASGTWVQKQNAPMH